MIETGRSKSQRNRRKILKGVIQEKEDEYQKDAFVSEVLETMVEEGFNVSKVEHDLEVFCQEDGKIYYTDKQRKYIRYLD